MWVVESFVGDANEFHQRATPTTPVAAVWWFQVRGAALALGSAQPIEHVDQQACARNAVEVVRRRSGGGAVLIEPDNTIWVDVLLPRTHELWCDDVGRSAWWLGKVWVKALAAVGEVSLSVHRGPMTHTKWSRHVCFAGVGGGEVVNAAGAKVVGISQRRTRGGARFQCALYRSWDAERTAALFHQPGPSPDDLFAVAATVDCDEMALRQSFQNGLAGAKPSSH